jgi:iron complex outermembrane recepter protein
VEEEDMSIARGKRFYMTALLCGAGLAAPLWAAPALAQGVSEDENAGNTIIVTAQRREQRLEEVPMTVAVVSQETLATTGVNTVRDLANVTSGFQVGQGGSFPQPAIRGVTALAAGSYENNVAVFVDGLYQTTPQILNFDLPSVQNIQILKGPQGTLYGRNATGGAILIDTIDPNETWTGLVEATYGRFNDYRGRAFVAGPISDKVGISLAGTLRHTDGYNKRASRTTPGQFDGNFLGLKQETFRAKLKAEVTENFTATLGYSYGRGSDPRGIIFTPIENVSTNYAPGTGRDTRPQGLGEVAGDAFELDARTHEGSLRLEFDTGVGLLRSVTGYSVTKVRTTFDFAGSYQPDSYSDSINRDRTFQQAIDFAIDAIDNVDLVLGGNYYNITTRIEEIPNSAFAYVGPPVNPSVTTVPLTGYAKATEAYFFRKKEAWAIFGDLTVQVTDRLSLNAGGRYSKETQNVSGYQIGYNLATGAPATCAYSIAGETRFGLTCTNGASAKRSSYDKFTPRASIRYEISPGTNVYASYSKGFRGGEWNASIPNNNPALWFDTRQETVDSFEIGLKSSGSRLRFDLAAFYAKFNDLQVSFTSLVPIGGVNTALVILQNAPSARIYGAEANFDFRVTDDFTVRGGATYLNARYGDNFFFTGSGVNIAGTGFNTNADPLKVFPNITVSQNLSGLQMSRAPDFTGFIGFEYNIPKGEGGIKFAANLKYTTSYVVTNPSVWGGDRTYNARIADADPTNNGPPINTELFSGPGGAAFASRASEQRARQEAFAMLNASITWTDPSGHYFVRAWGNNLTDVKYRIHYNPLATGTYQPIGEPLSFGGTIGYKF